MAKQRNRRARDAREAKKENAQKEEEERKREKLEEEQERKVRDEAKEKEAEEKQDEEEPWRKPRREGQIKKAAVKSEADAAERQRKEKAERQRIADEVNARRVAAARQFGTRLVVNLLDSDSEVTLSDEGLIVSVGDSTVEDYLLKVGRDLAGDYHKRSKSNELLESRKGPVISVAIDRLTGKVLEGWNGESRDQIGTNSLHPLLTPRLDSLRGKYPVYDEDTKEPVKPPQTQPYPHPDHPLRHAEVKAVNALLWHRGEDLEDTVLGEILVANFFPFKDGTPDAPCCANCHRMLEGVPSAVGRFTGFPPNNSNFSQ